jgi:hypothetical protein
MEVLQNILYIIITAAVPVLTTYICKFLYEKWSANKQAVDNQHVQDTLDQVISMVLNCVIAVNQTFADELKKKGEFNESTAKEAFGMCKNMAVAMLSEEAKKIIANIYGDVDIYLDMLIESTVKQVKPVK